MAVRYFTSRVRSQDDKAKRQSTYLDALAVRGGVDVHYGYYARSTLTCNACGDRREVHGEKRTDVNIATSMIMDAVEDRCDLAILVSGDGDLIAPIEAIQNRLGKSVWMAFPPNRPNARLEEIAHGKIRMKLAMLEACQLPDQVTTPAGVVLERPTYWRRTQTP